MILWGVLAAVASAEGSCAIGINGQMLCCAEGDAECIGKQRAARDTTEQGEEDLWRPKFAGVRTFAGLPLWDRAEKFDFGILGVPFDGGASYNPGARFAPTEIRAASRRVEKFNRLYNIALQRTGLTVVDLDDLTVTPYDLMKAHRQIQLAAEDLMQMGRLVVLGGDSTVVQPVLRAAHRVYNATVGPFAVVHFGASLGTGDSTWGHIPQEPAPLFWSLGEGLFDVRHSLHVGVRGTTSSSKVDLADQELGFATVTASSFEELGVAGVVSKIRDRLERRDGTYMPCFVHLDFGVLDPAFAPGVGSPEIGGLTSRELQGVLAGMQSFATVLGATLVDVVPAGDASGITTLAAANIANDLLNLVAKPATHRLARPELPDALQEPKK